jgi:hypothetical protein
MSEQQISLELDTARPTVPAVIPELRDEIAQAWGLLLGERVEVCFRGSQRSAITGILELINTPDFLWNSWQALQLRSAGFVFSSRDTERWTRL